MNWEDEFIERFCDVHKPSNPWQPTAYKWTLFKTTETEDVFVFIESLLKEEYKRGRIDECERILTDRSIFNMPTKIQNLLLERISELEEAQNETQNL